MAEAYSVAANFTLETDVPKVLRDLVEGFEKLRAKIAGTQEGLDDLGKSGSAITRMVNSLSKLQDMKFPTSLVEGAQQLESRLGEATEKMATFTTQAKEAAAAFKEMRAPEMGGGGGHGGHGGGGDPVMQGIAGGMVLDFMTGAYKDNATVDQLYKKFQDDQRLTPAAMTKIRANSDSQLDKYRGLGPEDVARNAGEAYTLSGGKIDEQSGIADMLDRLEQNMVLRGTGAADAQAQATAMIRALDLSNQFYNKKTGNFDLDKANASVDRVQAIVSASNGLVKGQNIMAFEKAAGRAGQNMSLEGEAEMAHLIDVNPSRAATALRSFESLFDNGGVHMTKKDWAFWHKQGIFSYDKKKKEWITNDSKLLEENPVEFMLKRFSGVSDSDVDAYTQRMNVAGQSLEIRGAVGNIRRQAETVQHIDAAKNDQQLLDSPEGKLIQFSAAMERFRVALGGFEAGPGTQILGGLTDGLERITKFMNAHPDLTEAFLKLTAALAAFAVVRGAATLLGVGEGLGALSKGLSLFEKGAAASSALEVLGATGAGSLAGLAGGIVALGAAASLLAVGLRAAFGDPSHNPHPNTNAHGQGYANRHPGDTPNGDTTWGSWLEQQWYAIEHPQSRNARGMQSDIHRESYLDEKQTLHITNQLIVDGRVLAENVSKHQMRAMRPGVLTGTNDPDWLSMPHPAGTRI